MNDKILLYKLLAEAFLDIRSASYEKDSMRAFHIADLFHNIIIRMQTAKNDGDYSDIIELLIERAKRKNMSRWLKDIAKNDARFS